MIDRISEHSVKIIKPASRGETNVVLNSGNGPASVQEQIDFVLAHPAMNHWLKDALKGALTVDPLSAVNDLEILNQILRQRADQFVRAGYRLKT